MTVNRLDGRICIVTGAASGIGRAIAIRFAEEGARVVMLDPRSDPIEGGETTLNLISAAGGEACRLDVDVSDWDQVDQAVGDTVAEFGALHVIVNHAAIYTGTNLLDTSTEDWDRVMAVNLRGVFNGCKRAVAQMLTQDPIAEARGRIVNISSQHGMIACPGDIAYGTSKAGCVYITRQIAADYAALGIVCNAVAPFAHADGGRTAGTARQAGRRRQRGAVSRQRRVSLHQRCQPDGRRRLDRGLSTDPCPMLTRG